MFTYLHCYLPETWDAQERAGLIRAQDGIRYCQSIEIDEKYKFNNMAKKGGTFYNMVKERRCPMYIDRLQGGCYIEDYPYDMSLIGEYKALLGDNFWGFQMHEWMSNYASDLHKVIDHNCPEWTEEAITETVRRAYPFPYLFLESMNAREFAEAGKPTDTESFLSITENLFAKRQKYTNGMLVPCDSYCLAYPLELEHGAKRLMPEVGAQTPDTRVQVAFARGMAKAYRVPFGTYYEPWGGKPFSACCYQKDGLNEWGIGGSADFPFQTAGGNGGSSRSLQRRIHLYSYVAGASFMAEEWGMCNTFYDWKDYALTPYGEVKRDFLRFTERYPDIGALLTPIAVVLPAHFKVLENIHTDALAYVGYPYEGTAGETVRAVRQGIRRLFASSSPMAGDETASLRNCLVPDALDIVTADAVRSEDYAYFVDLTGDAAFAAQYRGKIIGIDEVPARLDALLPCTFDGSALKLVSSAADGGYYVLLLNNSGVCRSVADGETLMPGEGTTVRVSVKGERSLTLCEGDASLSRGDDGVYTVDIPAGGWFFGKI